MTLTPMAEEVEPYLNIVAFGPEGSGKTTGALSAPGPILYVGSEGPNAIIFARSLYGAGHINAYRFEGRATLDEVYLHIKEGCEEQTLVFDSVGAAYGILLNEYANGGKPTLPNYGDAGSKLERFFEAVYELPIHVVLIGHEATLKDEESGEVLRTIYTGTSKSPLAKPLAQRYDVIAYCALVEDPENEGTPPRVMAQVRRTDNGRTAKDRTGVLGKATEFNVTRWVEEFRAAHGPESKKNTQTKEQK